MCNHCAAWIWAASQFCDVLQFCVKNHKIAKTNTHSYMYKPSFISVQYARGLEDRMQHGQWETVTLYILTTSLLHCTQFFSQHGSFQNSLPAILRQFVNTKSDLTIYNAGHNSTVSQPSRCSTPSLFVLRADGRRLRPVPCRDCRSSGHLRPRRSCTPACSCSSSQRRGRWRRWLWAQQQSEHLPRQEIC